ncbi:hypothetical protein K3G39_16200 [Pontibacter sp. HSC-14F20]|uniref:hypothetical protein n=1 Tax=Pontibacter sp. HSC-14F20 TaxID=2864136 RepID=UPI001C72D6EE|nr:hypothetical protein [Pontibacter sp. HSC-14F20]MBX0334784.1 hypothetical protein [Pontibacter sp. HSC-14F20]
MQLNKEETRFLAKWAKVKEGGQWRHILTRGLLWGALVSLFSNLFQEWDALKAWDTAALTHSFISTNFLIRLFMYGAIGIGIHTFHWNSNTKRYNELKNIERRSRAMTNATKE